MDSPDIEKSAEEKMDTDFLFFIANSDLELKNLPSGKDRRNAQLWLEKLLGVMPKTREQKKERNVYLAQLLSCVKDGLLDGIFTSQPSQLGFLPATSNVFQTMCNPVQNVLKESCDKDEDDDGEFTGEDIDMRQHRVLKSGDGRSYLAVKALPGGRGLMGYLAVSIASASGDAQWIDPEQRNLTLKSAEGTEDTKPGKRVRASPVDLSEYKELKRLTTQLLDCGVRPPAQIYCHVNQLVQKYKTGEDVLKILSWRRGLSERKRLLDHYKKLMVKIDEESMISEPGHQTVGDPDLRDLLHELKAEMIESGGSTDKMELLDTLKCRIFETYNRALERDRRLAEAESEAIGACTCPEDESRSSSGGDEELPQDHRVPLEIPKDGPIGRLWSRIVIQPPSSRSIKKLTKKYPDCLVEALVGLLERERWSVLKGLLSKHSIYDWDMRKDAIAALHDGFQQYKDASSELSAWRKLGKKIRRLIDESLETKDDPQHEDLDFVRDRAVMGTTQGAKVRLEKARQEAWALEEQLKEAKRELQIRTEEVEKQRKTAYESDSSNRRLLMRRMIDLRETIQDQERLISVMRQQC